MKYLKYTINNKQNPDTIQYQKIAARYPTYPPRKKGRDELKMMIKKEGKGKTKFGAGINSKLKVKRGVATPID